MSSLEKIFRSEHLGECIRLYFKNSISIIGIVHEFDSKTGFLILDTADLKQAEIFNSYKDITIWETQLDRVLKIDTVNFTPELLRG
jgi:hypothetical protein